jgi:hypothetical protein
VPGLPNIQALKPATKKKIMSATVATAKLWSARRHPSDDLVRRLACILIFPMNWTTAVIWQSPAKQSSFLCNVISELKFQHQSVRFPSNSRRKLNGDDFVVGLGASKEPHLLNAGTATRGA